MLKIGYGMKSKVIYIYYKTEAVDFLLTLLYVDTSYLEYLQISTSSNLFN